MGLVIDWITALASASTSSEIDSKKMQNVLRLVGFPSAIVVFGIVYLEGKGTLEAPPMSIHAVASMLLKTIHCKEYIISKKD
jgi:hypothetical protein